MKLGFFINFIPILDMEYSNIDSVEHFKCLLADKAASKSRTRNLIYKQCGTVKLSSDDYEARNVLKTLLDEAVRAKKAAAVELNRCKAEKVKLAEAYARVAEIGDVPENQRTDDHARLFDAAGE